MSVLSKVHGTGHKFSSVLHDCPYYDENFIFSDVLLQ